MTVLFKKSKLGHERENLPPPLRGFEHINRYVDRKTSVLNAKILPGEFYVTRGHERIVTVLGSCISACIRDTRSHVGGMNHFMLPANQLEPADSLTLNRYGNFAMENLINEILKNGGNRHYLEVKIFGGGKVLRQNFDVGMRNINFAKSYLDNEGLKIVAEDVAGIYPRKVVYDPITGKVKVKLLKQTRTNTLIKREEEYHKSLEVQPVEGDIELF